MKSVVVIVVLVVSMAFVALVAFAVAGTPGSDRANGSWVGGLELEPGPEPLVLWHLPGSGGRLGTCIYSNASGPLTGPYSKRATITDAVFGELNHLFARASTSDVRLAELSALNGHKYDRVDKDLQWSYVVNGQGGMSVADSDHMIARATELAGPYSVAVSWPESDTSANMAYQATVTVTSASGIPVPGAVITIAGTNVRLSSTETTTNTSGRAVVGFRIPVGTSSTFTISASVPSWTTVDVYESAGEQDMLVSGAPGTQSGHHTGAVNRERMVDLIKVEATDPANAPIPGYTFEITDSTGNVVDASVTTGTSPAAAPLGSLAVGSTYHAREVGVPAGARLYIPAEATTTFTVAPGIGTWTVVARDPVIPTPTISTQVDVQNAIVGQPSADEVTVAGDDGENGTIRATLYGPLTPPQSATCSDLTLAQYLAAPAQHYSLQVSGSTNNGNGVHRVVGPTINESGCWGWAELLTLTPSGASATSPPTAPNESTLVSRPQLTTMASAQAAEPGFVLTDKVDVTGMNGQAGTLLATLYGPLAADGGCRRYVEQAWQAAIASFGTALIAGTATTPVTGDGTYVSTPVTLLKRGCYTYQDVLSPDSVPASRVGTGYGMPAESTLVLTPAITTAASANQTDVGGVIRDRVTVTGMSGASGTVTGELLGPNPDHNGSCAGLDWAGARTATTIPPLSINGDGAFVTPELRLAGAGCYTFVERLFVSGASTPFAQTSAGIAAETVHGKRALISPPATPPIANTGAAPLTVGIWGVTAVMCGALATLLGRFSRPTP